MKRQKLRNLALASVPLSLLILLADVKTPGWGRFYNPVFLIRAQLAKLNTEWTKFSVNPNDRRLEVCQEQLGAPLELSEQQASLRHTLVGKSETFTITQLGTPACKMSQNVYRWLIEDGLSLDVEITDEGEIGDAQLSN